MRNNISYELQQVHDFDSLIVFLRDALRWPIPDDELECDDITFDWSNEYLRLSNEIQARIITCRQLRINHLTFNLPIRYDIHRNASKSTQQLQLFDIDTIEDHAPCGIFLIEFENNVKIDACRTLLRGILRGLTGGPKHPTSLPFWSYNKLLFICTTEDFQNIGFVRFMGKKNQPLVDDYIPLNDFKLQT